MKRPQASRRHPLPFLFALAFAAIVSLAVFRLPDAFVVQLRNHSPLSDEAGGWAYRGIVAAAVAQAFYAGWVILRPERVRRALERDRVLAKMPLDHIAAILSRNAAGITVLTIVYGVAVFWLTGQRGGYVVFPLLALAQGTWYYRQVGVITKWLAFQPEAEPERPTPQVWTREPDDYLPPLARGLRTDGS